MTLLAHGAQESALQSADRLAKLKATGEGSPLYEDFVKDRWLSPAIHQPLLFETRFERTMISSRPVPPADVLPREPHRQNKRAKYLSDNKTSVEESTDLEVPLPWPSPVSHPEGHSSPHLHLLASYAPSLVSPVILMLLRAHRTHPFSP